MCRIPLPKKSKPSTPSMTVPILVPSSPRSITMHDTSRSMIPASDNESTRTIVSATSPPAPNPADLSAASSPSRSANACPRRVTPAPVSRRNRPGTSLTATSTRTRFSCRENSHVPRSCISVVGSLRAPGSAGWGEDAPVDAPAPVLDPLEDPHDVKAARGDLSGAAVPFAALDVAPLDGGVSEHERLLEYLAVVQHLGSTRGLGHL